MRTTLLAALALTLLAGSRADAHQQLIRSPIAAYELRYPPGWHAARWPEAGLVVSSQPIAGWQLHGPYSRRVPGQAYVWITDYGQAHRVLPPLPRPLRLPPPQTVEGFGAASTLSFVLDGHQFQAFVAFGKHSGTSTQCSRRRPSTARRSRPPGRVARRRC
jgi:hypothetical protein